MADIDSLDDLESVEMHSNGNPEIVDDAIRSDIANNDNSNQLIPDKNEGLSMEEMNDPNAIKVTIDDVNTPVVILFGPPSSGKTMILVRLSRYLRDKAFTISPVKTFRPSQDAHYKEMCDSYCDLINSDDAASSTSRISFMLLKVAQKGHPICQILESPGEHHYLPGQRNTGFPKYLNNILNGNNRRIWLIILEPDWMDTNDRVGFVARINYLHTRMKKTDKVIFVYNKVDKTDCVINSGVVNRGELIRSAKNQYPGVFEKFKNDIPILRFFNEYNCEFVAFSTGDYNETMDGGSSYTQGSDDYPRMLWNEILKNIKG